MGAEIAQSLAVAGYGVRVRDVKPEGVARGLRVARDLTMRGVRRGRFARREGDEILSRLSGSVDYSGFRRAGLVIEAVFEDIGVKRKVIGELEDVLSPDAVIASNTSSLPIADIAAEAEHPQRIVGMHFFSPVHRMPLLEVVRGERTSDETVATAIEAGARMGKTVIVVQDGPGFYTTRTLTAMLLEAGRLFEEGVAIAAVDRAMTAFGFPVGPLALIDEVGLDVAAHILDVLKVHFPYFRTVRTMRGLVETGRLGRKSGGGFYNYGRGKKRPSRAVYAMREARPQPVPRDLIQRRLVMALLNEAARCLDEGIVASPRDADVGAVLGFGFPPFLGGPFRYADSLGLPIVLTEMRRMAHGYGELFNPAPLIERMAESGARFREVDG
jgi:3-hydroxyacyl-CoA dehydrogenase/enoyl-CoA hydratase/3-hydroxybutyryl-CoA epimerase